MKLTIHIDQKASLLAGHDAPNSREVINIEAAKIDPIDRETILPYYDVASGEFNYTFTMTHPLTEDRVLDHLRAFAEAIRAREAKKKAEFEAKVAAARECLRTREVEEYTGGCGAYNWTEKRPAKSLSVIADEPEAKEWLAQLEAENKAAHHVAKLAYEKNKQEENERERQEAEAKKLANDMAVKELLLPHATESQRERYSRSMLPDRELLALQLSVAHESLRSFNTWQQNARPTADPEEYEETEVMHKIDDTAGALTQEQFEKLKKIEKSAPSGAVIQVVTYQVSYRDNEAPWEDVRPLAKVTVPLGPWKLYRIYELE